MLSLTPSLSLVITKSKLKVAIGVSVVHTVELSENTIGIFRVMGNNVDSRTRDANKKQLQSSLLGTVPMSEHLVPLLTLQK